MATTVNRPLYLRDYLAPVVDEIGTMDLPVTGALPAELNGRYIRNGPNPLPGQDPGHWFGGQGMLHGIRISGGRAEWYRNRWVRTPMFGDRDAALARLRDGRADRTVGTANTHVIEHAGRILCLVESAFPYEVTPELQTVGPYDFSGKLTTAMTAHPKIDPVTGELHFFGYSAVPPYLTYHRVSVDGDLTDSAEVPVKGPTMMHDFAITERHAVFMDLPMVFRPGPGLPFAWDDFHGARLGVMPLARPGQVRWYEIDPCYVFHIGNAFEELTGRIVIDVARYEPSDMIHFWDMIGPHSINYSSQAALLRASALRRWTIDPAQGAVLEQNTSGPGFEFPTLDDTRVGRQHRYIYGVDQSADPSLHSTVLQYDLDRDGVATYELDSGVVAGEAVFIPTDDPQRAENDGWLMSITTTSTGTSSELIVLDATEVSAGPVARVKLPRAVPAGFHGSWLPEDKQPV